jgi:Flp pilus assembly protein TadD
MAMGRHQKTGGTRRALAAFLVIGLSLSVALHAQAPAVRHHKIVEADPNFPPELSQAEDAIEKKDYATAEPLLQKVVAVNPNNYQAWFDLGFVNNIQGKTDDSIAAYRKSVAAKPDVFESNLNLGLMLAKNNDPGSEQFLRAATQLKPTAHIEEGRARAWLSLAHVIEATKPEEAVEAYHQASLLQPKDPEPHLSAGALQEKLNHADAAEAEYRQALALDSKSSDALVGLVNIYMRSQRYTDAESLLRKLAADRPDDPAVHLQLGRMLAASGKKEDAIPELQLAAKLAPGDTQVKRDLGDLYLDLGKYPEAEAQYQPLLASTPKDPDLHFSLGRILLNQHKFPEAEQEFFAAAKLKPDFAEAYWNLAVAANENKNYPLAIQAADAAAKLRPEPPMSFFLRATAYDHLRNYKPAAENYHRFLEVDNGKYPDHEWQARHRLITIEPKQ